MCLLTIRSNGIPVTDMNETALTDVPSVDEADRREEQVERCVNKYSVIDDTELII